MAHLTIMGFTSPGLILSGKPYCSPNILLHTGYVIISQGL